MSKHRGDVGNTLVEVLIVIVVIGLLAAIAIPVYLGNRERSVAASMQSDLRTVGTLMESHRTDHPAYPPTVAGLEEAPSLSSGTTVEVVSVTPTSFCLIAENSAAAAPLRFDSDDGGLLDAGVDCD